VKQGTFREEELSLERGKDLKEDVTISVEVDPADKGVKAKTSQKTIAAGDAKNFTLTVTADEKAAKGKYKVKVTAKPGSGNPAAKEYTFEVPDKVAKDKGKDE
jgi:uncharacterized membrane protein